MSAQQQFLRQVSLVVSGPPPVTEADALASGAGMADSAPAAPPTPTFSKGKDLSEMHFTFQVQQSDIETPNNCAIRVYNLSESTVREIRGSYNSVVLRAGYKDSKLGIVFQGTIKQFRVGRETATDTFLDILAADGDVGYNWGFMNQSLASGTDATERTKQIAKSMGMNLLHVPDLSGKELIRGKVMFGMARAEMAIVAESNNSTWSIQDGQLQVTLRDGYVPGDIVKINAQTGMIGVPELTEEGVKVRTLLNPTLVVGGLVQINNADINQLTQQNPSQPVPFNQWTGFQRLAKTSADGYYRLYVVEHAGDTRGREFYSDLICLAVDFSSKKVQAQ